MLLEVENSVRKLVAMQRLKSNVLMLVEHERKQIATSGKKYITVQFLSFKMMYFYFSHISPEVELNNFSEFFQTQDLIVCFLLIIQDEIINLEVFFE